MSRIVHASRQPRLAPGAPDGLRPKPAKNRNTKSQVATLLVRHAMPGLRATLSPSLRILVVSLFITT